MSQLVLATAGGAIGGMFGPIGAIAGQLAGAALGGAIDNALFRAGGQTRSGPQLADLDVMASTEGAPIPRIYGRARLSGVFWKLAMCLAPALIRTAFGFHRLEAVIGPPDHERHELQWQYPIASGAPSTLSSTAPQKHFPTCVIAVVPSCLCIVPRREAGAPGMLLAGAPKPERHAIGRGSITRCVDATRFPRRQCGRSR